MAKTKQFKTASKKLLDLMVNAIYTHKDIFIRELISNASDAIDRRHHLALTDARVNAADAYEISITTDPEKRTLTITDNGIGLTEQELIDNLGTIAESGSQAFLQKIESKDADIIGQFGVGFYSAFMVAANVEIVTRSPFAETAYRWESKGASTYKIDKADKDAIGTIVTLHLLEDDKEKEEDYAKYLQRHTIESLVKKYSDYIRYPITMTVTEEDKDGKQKTIKKTLNSMIPIWKKQKKDIKKVELDNFYQRQFNDVEAPLLTIHTSVEGMLTYTALLFIPQKPAFDFHSEKFEKGLTLYSRGVFIMDKNKALIPDHFRFVRGLVDSADLSLNLSREMLQHDRQLKKIAAHIEKKITSELEKLLKKDRKKYVEFYEAYGTTLKYGIYDRFGANKDKLEHLILFKTSKRDAYMTLEEYLQAAPDDQKAIYYATGRSKAHIMNSPQMDVLKEQDIEVLLFTDEIDEFMVQIMHEYKDKPFKSIRQGESDLADDTRKAAIKEREKTHASLLKAIKKALSNDVTDVRLSSRLKTSAVCLISGEGLSLDMEKILASMPKKDIPKAERILEINPEHALFEALNIAHDKHPGKIKNYARLLYLQALLLEGQPLEDPAEFARLMTDLIVESAQNPS